MEKVRNFAFLGALLAAPSGYGLYRLIFFSLPLLRERFLFFLFVFLFVTGIALPVYAAMNKYFFTARRIIPQVIVRESIVTAILVDVLFWFQIGRTLNNTIIFMTVGGFVIIEILLRAQDTVQYRPGFDNNSEGKENEK